MDLTTFSTLSPTSGPSLLSSGKVFSVPPNLGKNNFTSMKSDIVYSIPDFNSSFPTITSSYTHISTATTTTRTTSSAYRRRRGPYRPRRPRMAHQEFLRTMDKTVMPIAFSVGIVGSLIVVPVFTCTPLKASALSHYLTAIAVSDILYLLSSLAVWISMQGYRFNNVIGVCQLTMFTLRLSRFMGTWYLFAAHVERCLVHFGSRRARVWCSIFRTKCIILGFFVFSLVGFLHYIWMHVVKEDYGKATCTIMTESLKHIKKLNRIELVVSMFIPMTLVVPMDLILLINLIIRRCRSVNVRRLKSNNNNSSRSNSSSDGGAHREFREERLDGYVLAGRQRSSSASNRSSDSSPPPPEFDLSREKSSATLVVIICGVLFVVFLLPSSIYRAKYYFQKGFMPSLSPEDLFTMSFVEKLDEFHHVYKCFLYFTLLRGFRHGLCYLRRCQRKRTVCETSLQETEV